MRVARERIALGRLADRLGSGVSARVARARERLTTRAASIEALSPLACLERGYAIVRRGDGSEQVVRDAATLAVGDPLRILFAHGRAAVRVETRNGEDER
jgi:exodeoxyribonuclease VII large subunit